MVSTGVPANKERCITGLAQWAGITLRSYAHTGNDDLLTQAGKTMYYLKSKQYLTPDTDLYGGLPGASLYGANTSVSVTRTGA